MDETFPLLKARIGIGACTLHAEDNGGRLPRFSMTAYTGQPMHPSGWGHSDPVILDISGMTVRDSLPVNAGHAIAVGHTESVTKSKTEIRADGVLSLYSPNAKDAEAIEARRLARGARNGFPLGASVEARYDPKAIDFVKATETVNVNGRNFQGPAYVARKTRLQAISILARTAAADSATDTTIASQAAVAPASSPFLHSRGIACRLGKLTRSTFEDANGRFTAKLICHAPDAFDASINCARHGAHKIILNAGHDAAPLLDTMSGLYVWRDAEAVRFAFYDCLASRIALRALHATGLEIVREP